MRFGVSIFIFALMIGMMFSSCVPEEHEQNMPSKLSWKEWKGSGQHPTEIHADSNEKVIVLLAKTPGIEPEPQHTKEYYQQLLFGTQVGSMNDYYKENSLNQMTITGEVLDWVKMDNTLDKYDEDYDAGDEWGIGNGVEEIVGKSDGRVDFSEYDQDNDGEVDNLMIIFVGDSDARNGDADGDGNPEDNNAIWPLKWFLQTDYSTSDGVVISDFFVCVESCSMGTFAHEFAHNLGLPDLYDTDYSSEGVGLWSIMASGGYLQDSLGQDNPAHLDAWSKYKLGWITPETLDPVAQTDDIMLNSIARSGHCLKVEISTTEYFLIEYRSNVAANYDAGLPESGILVWHIDESRTDAWGDYDNSDEYHPVVRLIQQDGFFDLEYAYNDGDASDVWTVFDKFTYDLAEGYYGDSTGLNFLVAEENQNNHFIVLSFEISTETAYFYSIDWNWADYDNDGFLESIIFEYDIDSTQSASDVLVKIDARDVLTDTWYQTVVVDQYIVNQAEADEFNSVFSVPEKSQGLYEFDVVLYLDGKPVDYYTTEHFVWLEDPALGNNYDEYFGAIEFQFKDDDNDERYDGIEAQFTYYTDDPSSPPADVQFEVFNPIDPENKQVFDRYSVYANTGSDEFASLSLQQTNLQPGNLEIYATLKLGDGVEEIFHVSGTFFWEGVYLEEKTNFFTLDSDGDGDGDTLELELHIGNSFETTQIVEGYLELISSDAGNSIYEYFVIRVGPPTRIDEGRSSVIEYSLFSNIESNYSIQLAFQLPNDKFMSVNLGIIHLHPKVIDGQQNECQEQLNSAYSFANNSVESTVTILMKIDFLCLKSGVTYELELSARKIGSVPEKIYQNEVTQILPNLTIEVPYRDIPPDTEVEVYRTLSRNGLLIIESTDYILTPSLVIAEDNNDQPEENSTRKIESSGANSLFSVVAILFVLISVVAIVLAALLITHDNNVRKVRSQFQLQVGTVSQDGRYKWDGMKWIQNSTDIADEGEFWVWNGSKWVPNPKRYEK